MDYSELLKRYQDFERLTVPPLPGERRGSCTSYDRHSKYDPINDRYIDWDANDDGTGYISKKKNGNIIAMELYGCGFVVHTWSALPGKGHIMIWIDDDIEPKIDEPFEDYFNKYSVDDIPSMNLTSLSYTISRGKNSYIPIPFSNYIRIELCPEWGWFYQFDYTLLDESIVTNLAKLSDAYTAKNQQAIALLDRSLYTKFRYDDSHEKKTELISIEPGKSYQYKQLSGAGIIQKIMFLTEKPLVDLKMTIYWDQEIEPSVKVNLKHFLGQSASEQPTGTIVSGYDRYYSYSNWHMPYSNGYLIDFYNSGAETSSFKLCIISEERCRSDMEQRLRFHSKTHNGQWKEFNKKRFEPNGDRWPDWPVWIVNGRGRFCGMHLNIHNVWKTPVTEPKCWFTGKWDEKTIDWWWGEGREKFFVDGEKFPSTIGTGSEDYFGYAWAAEPPFPNFASVYSAMNMPIDGNGDTSAIRCQIADDVPFQNRFEAFIEKYKADKWAPDGQCIYTATAFCYMMPGQSDQYI